MHTCPGSFDAICMTPYQIISLGPADIKAPAGSIEARFHGKIGGDRGLYARYKLPLGVAILAGLVLPILMLIAALVLFVRRPPQAK
jgi:hypothetical protein